MLTLTKPTSIHTHHNTYIKLCDGYWLRYAYQRKGVSRLHTTIKQFFKSINSNKNRLLSRRYHHHHHFDSPRADIFAAKGPVHYGSSCPWKWIWLKKNSDEWFSGEHFNSKIQSPSKFQQIQPKEKMTAHANTNSGPHPWEDVWKSILVILPIRWEIKLKN